MKIIAICGLSGSGTSWALRALESNGCRPVANVPLPLLPALARELEAAPGPRHPLAVLLDVRNLSLRFGDLPLFTAEIEELGIDVRTVFIEASEEVLVNRFTNKNRRHPLATDSTSLAEAIARESLVLQPARALADLRIDTTHLSIQELIDRVRALLEDDGSDEMCILLQSFGFSRGVPLDSNFVLDVRFLDNLLNHPELRQRTGLDESVAQVFDNDETVGRTIDRTLDSIVTWSSELRRGGRHYLTVAIGCSEGRHRSVYVVERLASLLSRDRCRVLVRHRDLPKTG